MNRPFSAYRGNGPYIFVSYSHADSSAVYEEMVRLHGAGFPIWFDEGIDPGSRWSEELAERIDACRLFLIFITPHSAVSQHCLRELNYAQKRNCEVLAVHLQDTPLTPGLDLALGDRQAILKHQLSDTEYPEKLLSAITNRLDLTEVRDELPPLQRQKPGRSPKVMAVAGLFVVALAAIGWFYGSQTDQAPQSTQEPSVAAQPEARDTAVMQEQRLAVVVLPFVNMSSDPNNEYFSDGMSEEILNALVKTSTIDVIARTSSFQFKGKNQNVQDIAAQLNVTHILEGSVRKDGNQVRITTQLIDAQTGVHLWSETFDRQLVNVFALQDEIANTVVLEIGDQLGTSNVPWSQENLRRGSIVVANRGSTNAEAYDLYLRALYETFNVGGVAAWDKALVLLDASTRIDREFAGAWRAIGLVNWLKNQIPPRERADVSIAALEKALALEPDDGWTLAFLGIVQAVANQRWQEGEALIRRGVELAPTDADVRTSLATLLWTTNRAREALVENERAYQLDPLNVVVAVQYARHLSGLGRALDAEKVLAGIGDRAQSHPMAWNLIYDSDLAMTRKYVEIVHQQFGDDSGMAHWADAMLSFREDPTKADKLAAELDQLTAQGVFIPGWFYSEQNIWTQVVSGVQTARLGTAELLLYTLRRFPQFDVLREQMGLQDFETGDRLAPTPEEAADYERRRVEVSNELLDTFAGIYVDAGDGVHQLDRVGKKLMLDNLNDAYPDGELIPFSQNHFVNSRSIAYYYTFNKNDTGGYDAILTSSQIPGPLLRTLSLSNEMLAQYAGQFTSPSYLPIEISVDEGRLTVRSKEGEWQLLAVTPDEIHVVHGSGTKLVFNESRDAFLLQMPAEEHRYSRVE